MKPQGRTVTVSVFRKGKQVSTTVLSIEEFRRRHPLGDPFNGRVHARGRPRKMKDADAPNVLADMHADDVAVLDDLVGKPWWLR